MRVTASSPESLKRAAALADPRGTAKLGIVVLGVNDPITLAGKEQKLAGSQGGERRRNKFGAVKVSIPGERVFDSKWEHALFTRLRLDWEDGRARWVWRQFTIPLPGNVTMRIDFALVEQVEGQLVVRQLIDAKGMKPTRDWINKRKQAESIYGIKIEERRR